MHLFAKFSTFSFPSGIPYSLWFEWGTFSKLGISTLFASAYVS